MNNLPVESFDKVRVTFHKGDRVRYDESIWLVIHSDPRYVLLEHETDRELLKMLPRVRLDKLIARGDIQKVRVGCSVAGLANISEERLKEFERRVAYCLVMREYERPYAKGMREEVITRVSATISDPKPPAISTLGKWFQEYRDNGYQLFPDEIERSGRPPAEDAEIKECLSTAARAYLSPNRPSKKNCWYLFLDEYRKLGFKATPLSYRSFCRRLEKIPAARKEAARFSPEASRNNSRTHIRSYELHDLMELVEADAIEVNIRLFNDYLEFEDPEAAHIDIARIYVVIEGTSGMVLGYYVDYVSEGENAQSAIRAIQRAVAPNPDPGNPAAGLFGQFVADGGAFKFKTATDYIRRYASQIVTTSPYAGEEKPFVESFNGILRHKLLSNMKGYIPKTEMYSPGSGASRFDERGRMPLSEFERRLHDFIIYQYHDTGLERLKGLSPRVVWDRKAIEHPPLQLKDVEDISMVHPIRVTRQPSDKGHIQIKNQHFSSEGLKARLDAASHYIDKRDKKRTVRKYREVDILYSELDASTVTLVCPMTGDLVPLYNVRHWIPEETPFSALKHMLDSNIVAAGEPTYRDLPDKRPRGRAPKRRVRDRQAEQRRGDARKGLGSRRRKGGYNGFIDNSK